jgi:hypothetical protein
MLIALSTWRRAWVMVGGLAVCWVETWVDRIRHMCSCSEPALVLGYVGMSLWSQTVFHRWPLDWDVLELGGEMAVGFTSRTGQAKAAGH